jgi:hypothetical protein
MFRPSRGHLQADILNILGSIQLCIVRGETIHIIICFKYQPEDEPRGSKHVAD